VLGLVVLASFFEMYDLYLFALTLQQIQADLAIPEASLGLLGSLVRLGALPAGVLTVLADRIGRRRVLLGTILAYTLCTGATACAPNAFTFALRQLSLSRFLSGMMRLSPHHTVTGGTTHGRCTVHRAAVPSDGVPGFHERDA
jgi:MFS family permease